MVVHFVYVKGERINTPHAITNEVAHRLAKKYDLKVYNLDEKTTIKPNEGDILIGHPDNQRNSVFRNSFWQKGWSKRIVMCPFEHAMPKYLAKANLDSLVVEAEHFLAICGKYWIDTMSDSITSHWQHKTIQLDLAVNITNFPFIKPTFGNPGKRKFLYIGHTSDWKGCDYLAALADANPELHVGWIGRGKVSSSRIVCHGVQDFSLPSSQELLSQYDFLLTCGRADPNPTTILESASWGLIPVCTPQSGYYNEDWIVNIPLDDIKNASAILNQLNWLPEPELVYYQQRAKEALKNHYNWDRFAQQVIDCIEAPAPEFDSKFFDQLKYERNRRDFQKIQVEEYLKEPVSKVRDKINKLLRLVSNA